MAQEKGTVQILEYQKPALEAGVYTVSAEQRFDPGTGRQKYGTTSTFHVSGPRFSLPPAMVRAVYPPTGALGDYSRVLPHVALKSPSLPWERSAYAADDYEPWLALLVIDEAEIDSGDVVVPSEAKPLERVASSERFKYWYRHDASDNDPSELVTFIDVRQSLLHRLLPQGRSLNLQCHVRRRVEPDGTGREVAVLFSSRLPRSGASTLCFLVSVEGLYNDGGTFRYSDPNSRKFVRLVSLTNWAFASLPASGKNFDQLVEDIETGTLVVPAGDATPEAKAHLDRGEVPLWHEMRSSDRSYSWFRGPLSPSQQSADSARGGSARTGADGTSRDLPSSSDELLIYHQSHGMFDVSDAAAFELGKALALNDRAFTSALFEWKQIFNRQVLQRLEHPEASEVLVGAPAPGSTVAQSGEKTDFLRTWLANLTQLRSVPFNYLVPDERMLPPESIRFFQVDPAWVENMLAGAFSVGGLLRDDLAIADVVDGVAQELAAGKIPSTLAARFAAATGTRPKDMLVTFQPDKQRGLLHAGGIIYPMAKRANSIVVRDPGARRQQLEELSGGAAHQPMSGILLRSQLVAGWPDMFIDAFARGKKLENIRASRMAGDVLLLLYRGRLDKSELYLKPEGLNFGLDERLGDDGGATRLSKDTSKGEKPVRWRSVEERVVDLAGLAADLRLSDNAAAFAMEMFEGSAKGEFTAAKKPRG